MIEKLIVALVFSLFSLIDQILSESFEERHIPKREKREYFMAEQTIQTLHRELFTE